MADEKDGAAVAAADDTTAAEDSPAPDPKVEAEAREMGWRPKDQFKGKPEDWRPAEDFVKRGREMLPIVNAENKKLRAELASLKAETDKTISKIERMNQTALKAVRAELEAKYDAQIDRAAEAGDVKAVKSARTAQRDALKAFDDEADDKPKAPAKGKDDAPSLSARDKAVMDDWMSENKWFSESRVLRAAADDAWDDVEKEMPGASMADKLAEVRERVAAEFPQKFGKKTGPKVEGGGDRGGNGNSDGGDFWTKVPAAVRPTADRHIKEGMYLDKGWNREALTPAQMKIARERWAEKFINQ